MVDLKLADVELNEIYCVTVFFSWVELCIFTGNRANLLHGFKIKILNLLISLINGFF